MQTDRADAFLDNWTYLKVELNWLERLLLMAVARQRKDSKEVDRVAQTKADRATSHWWKGMVSLDGIAYDVAPEHRKPVRSESSNHQQQINARIRASQQRGIVLALPNLCDRLKLNLFEKNVILLGLAPEIHRRYSQLYGYLQQNRECHDLPTVDLALRLFCRTDAEWRAARSRLLESSPLIQLGLIQLWAETPVPLLQRSIKLSDSLVNYLVDERSTLAGLTPVGSEWKSSNRLGEASVSLQSMTQPSVSQSTATFEDLVLPETLLNSLRHLCDRVRFTPQIEEKWGFQSLEFPGTIALLIGTKGTGKTTAVAAIAHSLNLPFCKIDLAQLTIEEQQDLIESTSTESILLIQSAERWIGRSTQIAAEQVTHWLEQRQKLQGLTVLAMQNSISIPAELRSRLDYTLIFPRPDAQARSQLWGQAFPAQTPVDPEIDWQELGRKFALTGGEITKFARSAAIFAVSERSEMVTLPHILRALSH